MKSKMVVGLMSGTSADGIDACLVKINPDLSFDFIDGIVYKYPENIRNRLLDVFQGNTNLEEICWVNFIIGEYFAIATNELIAKVGLCSQNVDLIGSHGQTVFHRPQDDFINNLPKRSTLQIGESSVIAERTGVLTVSDFRPADIAAGGEGAPLVCFADEVIFKSDLIARAVQNIGGISNVTVLSPDIKTFGFDTGPGNVIIDYCAKKYFGLDFDKDGILAAQGNTDYDLLEKLMQESYYKIPPPKTTGRELYTTDYIESFLNHAPSNPLDIMSTVTEFTACTIYNAYKDFVFPKTCIDELILGGGGVYNTTLIKFLKKYFGSNTKILSHKDFGVSDKFKEAIAFAMLAYSTYYRLPNNVPSCTGARKNKVLGKLTFP